MSRATRPFKVLTRQGMENLFGWYFLAIPYFRFSEQSTKQNNDYAHTIYETIHNRCFFIILRNDLLAEAFQNWSNMIHFSSTSLLSLSPPANLSPLLHHLSPCFYSLATPPTHPPTHSTNLLSSPRSTLSPFYLQSLSLSLSGWRYLFDAWVVSAN